MKRHGAFTIIEYIKPGMEQELARLLAWIDVNNADTNPLIPFRKIFSIHFARFVMIEERPDASGKLLPAALCFTTNYDLPLELHLRQLVQTGGPGLWQIFSCCAGFPSGSFDENLLCQYLKKNNKKSNTFYVGVGHRSVLQISNENKLRDAIGAFVDSHQQMLDNKDPLFVRQKIVDFVNTSDELAWARRPHAKPPIGWKILFYGKLALFVLVLLLFLPLVLMIVLVWMTVMLIHEVREIKAVNPITRERIRALTDRETGIVQAQFSALGNLKPGWFRLATVSFLLWLTDFMAPYLFNKGSLSGIPTVHFARWVIINEGRQMIFLSNYDGNSESYLRDFIHIATKQLTLLFSHSLGYPKTYLMVFEGAKDAKGFMEWARSRQVITNVWYSANKDLSVKNIYNNSKIRDGLYGNMTEKEARKWLSRI